MRLKFKARSEGWEALHGARFPVGLLCVCFPSPGGGGEVGAAGTGAFSVSSPEGVALSGPWASPVRHPSGGSEFPAPMAGLLVTQS